METLKCTVAHNCHGKTKNLTAKATTSRQNQKPHGKRKNLTAKPKTSRQKHKQIHVTNLGGGKPEPKILAKNVEPGGKSRMAAFDE